MGQKRKQRELTQAEIWDDSALIRSWDDAVEEYKLYHSIHAQGEDVEDAIRNVRAQDFIVEEEPGAGMSEDREGALDVHLGQHGPTQLDATSRDDSTIAHGSGEPNPHNVQSSSVAQPDTEKPESDSHKYGPGTEGLGGGHNLPQTILGNVQDESLKNLMMAWYFAGYYTGLYDGQQHGQK